MSWENGSKPSTIFEWMSKRLEIVAGLLLVLTCLVLLTNILSLWLGVSNIGTGEIARVLFMWFVFIIAGLQARSDNHFRVTYVFDRVSARFEKDFDGIVYTVEFLTVVLLLVSSITLLINTFDSRTSTLRLPVAVMYGSLVVGSILYCLAAGLKVKQFVYQ